MERRVGGQLLDLPNKSSSSLKGRQPRCNSTSHINKALLQWLQVQLQKAEQNAAAAYHESIKAKDEAEAAKDEAEAAKDEAKKAVSDMEQHMARRRRKRKHYTIPCPKLAVAEALAEVHPTRIACPCKVYAGKWKQARSALILAKTAIA